MAGLKGRISTLKVMVSGSKLSHHASYHAILKELDEVHRVMRLEPQQRRRLLQILHSTRALDSSLAAIVVSYIGTANCPDHSQSLGGYLVALANHWNGRLRKLPESRRLHFQEKIANVRNRYMHKAGEFPANENEIF